ncbi:hypothetical protein Y032_0026g1460 [Ancylostoma ceylanicum]|uniref:Uncharacterized protein n=1 Tax=Ancylostoma ceylanicum TaxID=53326 RepID=A0A016UUR3_9BILA|nr:hypothetical protein Y032_0026g1460 [Ancylostoma ceylanicum]
MHHNIHLLQLKCRDGKWTLPDSSIRLTHILCDQYIIDKKKAANSPFKPVRPLTDMSTTMPSAMTSPEMTSSTAEPSTSTMSDFDDNDIDVNDPDATEGVMDNFHEATTEDTLQITDETKMTEAWKTSGSADDPKLPTITSEKTKQVLVQAVSQVTTTPMTTAYLSFKASQPAIFTEDDLLTTAEQHADVATAETTDAVEIEDVHSTGASTDIPNEPSTELTTPAELDVGFMDILNGFLTNTSSRKSPETTSFPGLTTVEQKLMEIQADERDPRGQFPNPPPPHVDPYDGTVFFPESELEAQKAPSPVKPRKQLKQVVIPNRRIDRTENHYAPGKGTVVRARPLATGQRRRYLRRPRRYRRRKSTSHGRRRSFVQQKN